MRRQLKRTHAVRSDSYLPLCMVAGEERRSEEQLRTNFQAVFDACASRSLQSSPPLLRMLRLVACSALDLGGALGIGGARL